MEWIRVTVYTTSFGIDALCNGLEEMGINGFEIEDEEEFTEFLENNKKYWDYVDKELVESKKGDTRVKFYIEKNPESDSLLADVGSLLEILRQGDRDKLLGRLELCTESVFEEDWANNWKEYFKPIAVGERILIQPEWSPLEEDTDRIVFTVNPGMTFGTGTHASTKMCICELEKYVKQGTLLLDAGCGSGILSVIALMLGAARARAVDIDENCIRVAYENAERNGVDKSVYDVYAGDIISDKALYEKIGDTKYDVIVANIVADVIIALLPTVQSLIAAKGVFICSGIIADRLEDVKEAMKERGIEVSSVRREDDWCCITCIMQD